MEGSVLSLPLTNPVQVFAAVMVVILVAPLLLRRLRLPGLVGLIVAGVLLGPHALHVLQRGPTMQLLGMVGLLYIMFTAGLEFDLNEFDRHRARSLIFGTITFALPQFIGTGVARLVLGFDWLPAILLGSVFASHTLLSYPVVSRLGIARSEIVTTAVGATILTDTAALLVLALVAGAATGGITPLLVGRLAGLLAVFSAVVLMGLPRLGRWFFRRSSGDGAADYAFVLAAVFVSATVAELIGVEAIIGAFLAGLGLNRLVPEQSTLMNRIQFVGESLFIPFFLLATGMLVDLQSLRAEPGSWAVAGWMVGTVVVTKGLAAWSTTPLFGYQPDERKVVLGLTLPQAAATLAAVLVGYEVGLFGTTVINGAVVMMLITCMLGPWLADRYGRRVAAREARKSPVLVEAPQRILVPLANPRSAPLILDLAALIRDPRLDQPLYVVAIAREGPEVVEEIIQNESVLAQAVVQGAAASVPVQPVTRVEHNVAHGLLRAVRETRSSVVVMGWDALPAAERFLFGSISDQLLAERGLLLVLCRLSDPPGLARRIVVAVPPLVERETGAGAAFDLLRTLSRQAGAPLAVLAAPDQHEILRERLEPGRPAVAVSMIPLAAWDDVPAALEAHLQPDDLLVLLGSRRGSVSWRPGMDRLPQGLVRSAPDTPLIVVFPAGGDIDPEDPRADSATAGLSPQHVDLNLPRGSVEEALQNLLRPRFDGRSEVLADTAARLSVAEGILDLNPGLALCHARLADIRAPWLAVGVSRDGLAVPRALQPVHVLVVLLTPEELPSEVHLRLLQGIAEAMHEREAVESLRRARTRGEVEDLLRVRSRAGPHG